jgi:hypothetical protein
MSDRREIQLDVTLDGRLVNSETTCEWAGPYALGIATVLPDTGLAAEVHSIFVGHEGVPTCVTHLSLGPIGYDPFTRTAEHEHSDLNPKTKPRECAYEHMGILIETLKDLGYDIRIDMPEDAFGELERVER